MTTSMVIEDQGVVGGGPSPNRLRTPLTQAEINNPAPVMQMKEQTPEPVHDAQVVNKNSKQVCSTYPCFFLLFYKVFFLCVCSG